MSRVDETALGKRVRAFSAAEPDYTHGLGTVIAYTEAPTVTIQTYAGQKFTWRADLCEFVKPDEPEGLGAVVEVAHPVYEWARAVRVERSAAPWWYTDSSGNGGWRTWGDLIGYAVRVLSEGVS